MRVMAYNIHDGGRDRLHLIATVIERERPDAIALLEATEVADLSDRLRMHLAFGEADDFNALQRDDEPGTPPPGVEPRGDALPGAARDVLCPLARAGYVDCYRVRHADPGYTYPADLPWLRIDYAFASADLAPRVEACEMVTSDLATRASDHLPLVVELSSGAAAAEGRSSPARRSP
jgi:endonuclease/exonuclease/phosphatase family metal-dependent hydrolase